MLTQSNFSKKKKSLNHNLNKNDIQVNRGLELILNGGKKRKKPFHIIFSNIICFFNTEIDFYFEFSLNLRKKNNSKGGNK